MFRHSTKVGEDQWTPNSVGGRKSSAQTGTGANTTRTRYLKKNRVHLLAQPTVRYQIVEAYRKDYPVSVLFDTLGVSLSGYYAWKNRPLSQHQRGDHQLAEHSRRLSRLPAGVWESTYSYGSAGSGNHRLLQTGGSPHARTGIVCVSVASSDNHDTQCAWSACRPQSVGSRFYSEPSQ
jgi:hypothetical protein